MHPDSKLEKGKTEKDIDETRYRDMISSLMYLTSFKPDIVQSIRVCSQFQLQSKESNLSAVKRIIRYIHGTSNYDLWYPKSDKFSVVGYCDTDLQVIEWIGEVLLVCCFLSSSLNVWSSKKQSTVALSTTEAKYIAASSCCS
ncbi:uncharacterized mitochondrial protein AtMg00810-like [Arachis stenosperma]|uniref:uncharacterized mitochondrial protein AtMg00810-like n=1 Tax=Arachis stenosperma TaxID=217475 RepID=UPI0025AC010B|nr:uncharacterized mitochondrial protein AtMg00810-like [Arachis stenosperma]